MEETMVVTKSNTDSMPKAKSELTIWWLLPCSQIEGPLDLQSNALPTLRISGVVESIGSCWVVTFLILMPFQSVSFMFFFVILGRPCQLVNVLTKPHLVHYTPNHRAPKPTLKLTKSNTMEPECSVEQTQKEDAVESENYIPFTIDQINIEVTKVHRHNGSTTASRFTAPTIAKTLTQGVPSHSHAVALLWPCIHLICVGMLRPTAVLWPNAPSGEVSSRALHTAVRLEAFSGFTTASATTAHSLHAVIAQLGER
nr:hypothetical protein HmN_000165400 [Hymenolepis microstoma]